MGRNDMCFCGSGRKQKKCHPNIDENSKAAKIIELYEKITRELDEQIYGKVSVKCKKGCNECCKDYFGISEVEFAIIMDYLYGRLGSEKTEEIIKKGISACVDFEKRNPSYFKQLEQNVTGMSGYESMKMDIVNMPEKQDECLFLDEDGGCSIYAVRPIICRTHGVCYFSKDVEHAVCDMIPSYKSNMENMLNIDKYENDIREVGAFRKTGEETLIMRRKYPFFYFIKMYFGAGQSIADYFKLPVTHHILHSSEDMLYDYVCFLNGIK